MKDPGYNLSKCLLKRQIAIEKYRISRESFLASKEKIIKDIEEARIIWKNTLKKLPDQELN